MLFIAWLETHYIVEPLCPIKGEPNYPSIVCWLSSNQNKFLEGRSQWVGLQSVEIKYQYTSNIYYIFMTNQVEEIVLLTEVVCSYLEFSLIYMYFIFM